MGYPSEMSKPQQWHEIISVCSLLQTQSHTIVQEVIRWGSVRWNVQAEGSKLAKRQADESEGEPRYTLCTQSTPGRWVPDSSGMVPDEQVVSVCGPHTLPG